MVSFQPLGWAYVLLQPVESRGTDDMPWSWSQEVSCDLILLLSWPSRESETLMAQTSPLPRPAVSQYSQTQSYLGDLWQAKTRDRAQPRQEEASG